MCENSKHSCISGFGQELTQLSYEGASNCVFAFSSLWDLYSAHFSYLLLSTAICIVALLCYLHAQKNGNGLVQLWLGAAVHGVVSEVRFTAPKYWYAQGLLMFFRKSLPVHVILQYPAMLYLAMTAVSHLGLSATQPLVLGLVTTLLEVPYKIIAVRFLHITYHDTDPSYHLRFYGLPCSEIISTVVSSSSYVALNQLLLVLFPPQETEDGVWLPVFASVLSPYLAILQKIIFFHVLHDYLKVNSVVCLFFLVSVYLSLALCDRMTHTEQMSPATSSGRAYLLHALSAYLLSLLYLALFGSPQTEVSIGRHEPTGDCTTLTCVRTPLGKALTRRKYLCADEVADRKNFVYNFACVPNGPPCLNAIWYTICGSAIRNRAELVFVILSFLVLIVGIFLATVFKDILEDVIVSKVRELAKESGNKIRSGIQQQASS